MLKCSTFTENISDLNNKILCDIRDLNEHKVHWFGDLGRYIIMTSCQNLKAPHANKNCMRQKTKHALAHNHAKFRRFEASCGILHLTFYMEYTLKHFRNPCELFFFLNAVKLKIYYQAFHSLMTAW